MHNNITIRVVALGVGSILAMSPLSAFAKTTTPQTPHKPAVSAATEHDKTKTHTQTNTHHNTKPKTGKTIGTSENTNKAGASAQCNDGLYSHSTTHAGSCSGHGGVKTFLK